MVDGGVPQAVASEYCRAGICGLLVEEGANTGTSLPTITWPCHGGGLFWKTFGNQQPETLLQGVPGNWPPQSWNWLPLLWNWLPLLKNA